MTTPPLTDPTQQPITADDPRVAQILALIRAKGQAPVNPDPSQSTQAVLPQQPMAQLHPPQPPATVPTGRVNELGSQLGRVTELGDALPSSQPSPDLTTAPNPGPIKSFLQSLVSGLGDTAYQGTQGALQRLGLPTDYEKQQNALKIGLQQQQQNSLEGLRRSQQDLYSGRVEQLQGQMTPTQIPNDPKYGAFAGTTMTLSAASAVMQKMESLQSAKDISAGKNATTLEGKQLQYGPGSYLRRAVRSIGGRIVSYDKGDPDNKDLQKDLGVDTAMITGPRNATARAQAQAMYRTFDTTDANGAPVTISGLDALQGGAAHVPYTQAKGILSDRVGVQQYQDILDNKIAPNLAILNDNNQRIAIAHTLSEVDKNPGAMQALLTSALQDGALSPAGAQLTAGIMQAREFGGVARKYGGNMNGTEGLMNRIMSNQASPLNSLQLNQDLVANDRAFTQKALTNIGILTGHSAKGKTGPPNTAPSIPADNGGHPSFFHPLTP